MWGMTWCQTAATQRGRSRHMSWHGQLHETTANTNSTGLSSSTLHSKTLNPLTPTVAIWVQLWSILCQTGLRRHLWFLTSGHSNAQGWASECPDVKNYKQRLNPVWHRMLHSCTHMVTVGVKGLSKLLYTDTTWYNTESLTSGLKSWRCGTNNQKEEETKTDKQ